MELDPGEWDLEQDGEEVVAPLLVTGTEHPIPTKEHPVCLEQCPTPTMVEHLLPQG